MLSNSFNAALAAFNAAAIDKLAALFRDIDISCSVSAAAAYNIARIRVSVFSATLTTDGTKDSHIGVFVAESRGAIHVDKLCTVIDAVPTDDGLDGVIGEGHGDLYRGGVLGSHLLADRLHIRRGIVTGIDAARARETGTTTLPISITYNLKMSEKKINQGHQKIKVKKSSYYFSSLYMMKNNNNYLYL